MERRIVVCSNDLGAITSTILIVDQLIYPFAWQHTYIPMMPPHVKEVCCAMMPYLIGVHKSLENDVMEILLEVRQLRHCFGPGLTRVWHAVLNLFSALHHPTRAVRYALRRGCAYRMLIGACNPTVCPSPRLPVSPSPRLGVPVKSLIKSLIKSLPFPPGLGRLCDRRSRRQAGPVAHASLAKPCITRPSMTSFWAISGVWLKPWQAWYTAPLLRAL